MKSGLLKKQTLEQNHNESFLAEWARELGVARATSIRLRPVLAVLSAVELGRLRVATRAVAAA